MIKDDLLSNGPCYSLFQAVRLIRHILEGKEGETAKGLRLKPRLSLGFPASGVERIDESGEGVFTITANLLALYGAGSPLPAFYTEDLFGDEEKSGNAVKGIIDVVNHRLYLLLYEAWTMYRSMVRIVEEGDDVLIRRFYNLIGLDSDSLGGKIANPGILLRYSGLFAMNARSAAGLEALLSDALRAPVRVIQMIGRKGIIPDDQKGRLGKNIRLGLQSSLGRNVQGKGGAFRIEIGPVSTRDYQRLVPGSPDHDLLVSLTGLYVSSPLSWDMEILLDKKEKPRTVCLGSRRFARLGLDTWVFSKDGPEEFRTRFQL